MPPTAKANVRDKFVDFDEKSYEYSYSDGEVDEAQGYPSEDEVPSEPVRECKRLSRLNTTGTLGRAALKVQSYKCVPAVRFLN